MAAYAWTLVSLNGVALSGGNLRCYFDRDDPSPLTDARTVKAIEAEVTGLGAVDVRGQPQPATWLITIEMTATQTTDLASVYATFSEELGQVVLVCNDGDGTAWRTNVRVLGAPMRITANLFKCAIRCASPVWQANSLTTDTKAAQAGDSTAITLTNAGNRKARPTFAITPNSAKTDLVDDYGYQLRGFIVNRTSDDFTNLPVWLFDQGAVQARLATDSSASGATVKRTSGLTTTAEILDGTETDIDVTDASAWPSAGMYYITDGANDEQGYYTGKSGNTLTGCVRGIGGTAAVGHASGVTIQPSGILKNGDDTRVWIDDVEYSRWLVGWNSAASDVIVNITLPGKIALTLTATLTAAATSCKFAEGAGRLGPSGFLAVENEVFYYAHNDGDGVSGIVRGVWGTSAVQHLTSAQVLANPRQFVVATGKAKATAPPSPVGQRPAPQLNGSGNATWKWGDQADDASTVFYDPAAPGRTAQWTPGLDLDGNDIVPLTQLAASGTILTFKDDTPGDGSPPYNYAEIALPQGVRSGLASAFSADWTPTEEVLNLELLMRDQSGNYKLIDELQQSAAAAARVLPASLAAKAYAIKLKGRYSVIAGARCTGSTEAVDNTSAVSGGQQAIIVRLDAPAIIKDIIVPLAGSGAGNTNYDIALNEWNGDNNGDNIFFSSKTKTTTALENIHLTPEVPVSVPAGTYSITIKRTSFAGMSLLIQTRAKQNLGRHTPGNIKIERYDGTNWATVNEEPYALIIGTYDQQGEAGINADQPVKATTGSARTGATASFDKVAVVMASPDFPFVHRTGAFAQSLYHAADRMVNATTGDEIAFDKWMVLNSTLRIDCDGRVAEYTEQTVTRPVPRAITPSNPADWMALVAGANSLTYFDPNMVNTDIVSTFRSAKV